MKYVTGKEYKGNAALNKVRLSKLSIVEIDCCSSLNLRIFTVKVFP